MKQMLAKCENITIRRGANAAESTLGRVERGAHNQARREKCAEVDLIKQKLENGSKPGQKMSFRYLIAHVNTIELIYSASTARDHRSVLPCVSFCFVRLFLCIHTSIAMAAANIMAESSDESRPAARRGEKRRP